MGSFLKPSDLTHKQQLGMDYYLIIPEQGAQQNDVECSDVG